MSDLDARKLSAEELEEEAIAEEEFVSQPEDTISNPLVIHDDGEDDDLLVTVESKEEVKVEKPTVPGAIMSEEQKKEAFNNEQALREEKMDTENKKEGEAPINEALAAEMDAMLNGDTAPEAVSSASSAAAEAAPVEAPGAVAESVAEPVAEPTVEPVAEPVTAPAAEPVVESVAEPAVEPAVESVAPAAETASAEGTEVVAEPVAPVESVTEPVPAEPVVAATAAAPVLTDAAVNAANATPAAAPLASAAAPVATTAENKPKGKGGKKTGIIIGFIVAAALVVSGAVAGGIYLTEHEKPENMVADAMESVLMADKVQYVTKVDLTKLADNEAVKSLVFEFNASNEADKIADGNFTIHADIEGLGKVDLGANLVYEYAGKVYIHVNGIKSVNGVIMGFYDAASELNGASLTPEQEKAMSDVRKAFSESLDKLLGIVEENWIVIDKDSLPDDESKKSFQCFVDYAKKTQSKETKDELVELYEKNPFVTADKEVDKSEKDIAYIKVDIDKAASKKFGKAVKEMKLVKEFAGCTGTELDAEEDEEVEFEGEIELGSDTYEIKDVYFGVKGWSHELAKVKLVMSNGKENMDVIIDVKYEDKKIEVPSKAITAEEFQKKIEDGAATFEDEVDKAAEKAGLLIPDLMGAQQGGFGGGLQSGVDDDAIFDCIENAVTPEDMDACYGLSGVDESMMPSTPSTGSIDAFLGEGSLFEKLDAILN